MAKIESTPTKSPKNDRTNGGKRQLVGISLDPETAKAFKTEAVRRGVSLNVLFREAWALYLKKPSK